MTWFRVGGAGIPTNLKNNMNSVLNKKFGTSGQDYPPNGWPADVNLLGPLPKGTASGPIANFSDGADDVPTKSVVVTIPATLDGVSSVTEKQTGQNLVALNVSPDHVTVENGVTINTQTSSTLNMTTTGVAYACERLFYKLRKGTYTARFLATSSDSFVPKVALYKFPSGSVLTSSFSSNESKTFTLTEDTIVDIRLFASGNADTTIRTVEYTNFQLEVGSTAHAYEAYSAPTVYTASLGRTIYGGAADIVNGTGTDENGNDFTFTGQEVNTRYGVNNFWNDDGGDTTVVYRRDIDLALQALQGSRSLSASLMRSAGPEEVSEPEENIKNTEEQEGDNDAR